MDEKLLINAQLHKALFFNNHKYMRIMRSLSHDSGDRIRAIASCSMLTSAEHERFMASVDERSLSKFDERMRDINATIIPFGDNRYPAHLENIYNPPALLYCCGKLVAEYAVGIVGARKMTPYGRAAARKIAKELAANEVVVVSGAARGVDSVAHEAALEIGMTTIAVLGCGIDTAYPRENAALLKKIMANGAVVSEYPPGTEIRPFYFPMRNRIISGLSQGVLVVEAGERSGALITADFALDQGRDVFAVPGTIFSELSVGCNRLIKNGAKLVESGADIIEEIMTIKLFSTENSASLEPNFSNPEEEQIYRFIPAGESIVVDELCMRAGQDARSVNGALFNMLMRGIIREETGKRYSRNY